MMVVDASALLELLLQTAAAPSVAARLLDPGESLHAPHLIDLEIAQVLRRYAASGQLDDSRAQQALADLAAFPLTRYPHEPFLSRIWELRRNVTAYDGAYLALAEALDAPLITCDTALASAAGCKAAVEVL